MPSDWSSDVCRSEEHTSELQSHDNLVCRLLLEKKKKPQGMRSLYVTLPRAHTHLTLAHTERRDVRGWRPGHRGLLPGPGRAPARRFFFKDRPPPESSALPLPAHLPI